MTPTQLRHEHWRRLVKNIGWANQNIGGQKVVKCDKCTGISQLLGRHVPGLPPKVYAYGQLGATCLWPVVKTALTNIQTSIHCTTLYRQTYRQTDTHIDTYASI